MSTPLLLASRSPRRAELLRMLGLSFEAVPADIDETFGPGEDPVQYTERLAREKAESVAVARADAVVIGSDTVVVVDDMLFGKPKDIPDAVRMLLQLQGRDHVVATGIAVARSGVVYSAVEQVTVRFCAFDADTAVAYAQTGEPLDKAGAYGIQGRGATLVERIDGDYFAVMGLPVHRMIMLLREAGLHYDFERLSS